MLTLYVDSKFLSPYAWSVFIALRSKVLPFDIVPVNLSAGEHRVDPYATMSMTQRVPMLVDTLRGRFALTESSAICEYLEDQYPPPEYWSIFPEGSENRARARQIMAWLRSDFLHLKAERPTECIFRDREVAPLSEAAQAEVDKLYAMLQKQLSFDNRCLFTREHTLVDHEVAIMLQRLRKSGDPMPDRVTEFAKFRWGFTDVQEWIRLSFDARNQAELPPGRLRLDGVEPEEWNRNPSLRLVPKPE